MSGNARRWLDVVAAFVLTLVLAPAVAWWRGPAVSGAIGDGTGFARTRAWLTAHGFSPPEVDAATGQSFSWSSERAALTIPRLRRDVPYTLTIAAQAGRPGPAPQFPTVTVRVDDRIVATEVVGNAVTLLRIAIAPASTSSLRVDLTIAPTFVPGGGDSRQLGIVVRDIALVPGTGSGLLIPWRSLLGSALAAALAAGVLALFTTFLWARVTSVMGLSAAAAAFLCYDAAMLGPSPDRLVWTAAIVLTLALLSRVALHVRPEWRDDPWLHTAIALTWVLALAKWWCFVHPQINLGDSLFQVHRAEWVWSGRYLFTSTTPKPYFEFPYAIGLYVASWPLGQLFTTPTERVLALRGLTLLVDAASALALLPLVARLGWTRWGLVACAILSACCRMSTQVLCASNLTNLFAQSLFTVAVACLLLSAASPRSRTLVVAGTLLLTTGFLSHFSTLLVGVPIATALAIVLWWRGSPVQRRAAAAVGAALVVSMTVAYGSYYSRFDAVYATTFERVMAREGEAARGSIVAPPAIKAVRARAETVRNFGWSLLVLAAVGLVVAVRRAGDDVIARALGGWTLVWAALTVLGVVSAVELRANLSMQPVVAVFAAAGVGWLANRRSVGPLLATVALAVVAVDGMREWIGCVIGYP